MAVQTFKSPNIKDNYKFWLKVKIVKAENIDSETSDSAKRSYSVFAWVGPKSWIETITVDGSPDPYWNTDFYIPLDQLVHFGYLGVEIYRSSSADPSPSTCKVLVGRTLIPFQKEIDWKKCASYELMVPKGPEWVAGGSITIVTKVKPVHG